MTTIKGPGIFLAQFMGEEAPFNNLKSIFNYLFKAILTGIKSSLEKNPKKKKK